MLLRFMHVCFESNLIGMGMPIQCTATHGWESILFKAQHCVCCCMRHVSDLS